MPRGQARFGPADLVVLFGFLALIYAGLRLALGAPGVIAGPSISLATQALPYYTLLSVGRMLAAYLISLVFALSYGYVASRSAAGERGLIPLLDVLQSVPILSFLPVAVLSLSALLPEAFALELSSIILIVTSQAWNMAFSVYQSFTTVPRDLREASQTFQLHPWLRFKLVELPFAARALIWNSMLSWAGGWFFLMAAETFTVGQRDFRLPGLGSYLQAAAQAGDTQAVAAGLVALVATIVALDQIIWRPALAWSERFRLESVEAEEASHSWLYDLLSRSWLVEQFLLRVWQPLNEALDRAILRLRPGPPAPAEQRRSWLAYAVAAVLLVAVAYGALRALQVLIQLPSKTWLGIGLAAAATLGRVLVALALGTLWTLPAGVLIGTNRRVAVVAQPVVQVIASIPATALFPIIVVLLINRLGGINLAAVLLMLLGTQWYILFNVIAGAAAIPRDLYYTADMLGLGTALRWRTLTLPALYPYLITGLITASGGAWNASIVAEYVVVAGKTYSVVGVGATIAGATAVGDYALLMAATLTLILVVVGINRLVWRRLYLQAAEQYRLE